MKALRIKEALAYALLTHKNVSKAELAKKLFPDSPCADVNFRLLVRGEREFIRPEWVDILCAECGVTPNFLFGYE